MSRWRSRLRMWMREQRRRSSLSLPVVVIQVIIILSGVTASLCEAVAQSNDPDSQSRLKFQVRSRGKTQE